MLIVDASAVTELLLGRPSAAGVERHMVEHEHSLHAPHLIDVEVLSALRRLVAAGEASATRAGEAVADLLALRVTRYPHDLLVPTAWALRENVSTYDAMYLALAEALREDDAELLTADARFARAARAHTSVAVLQA